MPKASKATAPHHEDMGVMEGNYAELDGYTVGFETFREDADATPLFRGLPGDRCQSPHWGYVVRGKVIFHFADRSEIYQTGDAYYAPPGHIPVVSAGTELVEFSDSAEFARTVEAIGRNMAEMQTA